MHALTRRAGLLLASMALALFGGFSATQSAHAATARPAAMLAPSVQIYEPAFNLALNRSGGGTGVGTQAISYFFGDNNNDAEFIWLSAYCGNGHVTLSCPNFGNSAINSHFNGRLVVAIEMGMDHGETECLGLNGQTNYCPAPDGTCPVQGQCQNTVFMTQNCSDITTCHGVFTEVLNYRWTVNNHTVSYLKIPPPAGQKIIIGYTKTPIQQVAET